MCWEQFALILVTFAGLFVWNRTENRADVRHMDSKLEANRQLIIAFHNEVQSEMKDFHGRLEKQDAEFKAFLMNKKV